MAGAAAYRGEHETDGIDNHPARRHAHAARSGLAMDAHGAKAGPTWHYAAGEDDVGEILKSWNQMRRYYFSMSLSSDQCQQYYSGEINYVLVTDEKGARIRIRFKHFLPFLGIAGIRGRFVLTLDEQFAFESLKKIA